jgi:type II secretory pathway component PulF
MPTYEYTARDREGNVSTGILIAENENQLRQTLRLRELFVTSYGLRSDHAAKAQSSTLLRARKVKLTDMVVMSRQWLR